MLCSLSHDRRISMQLNTKCLKKHLVTLEVEIIKMSNQDEIKFYIIV